MILGTETLIRRRFDAGHRDPATGEWVEGAATEAPFDGSWQPVGRKDREVLPEGIRSTVERMVFCDPGTLRTVDQEAGILADHVVRDGVAYEVVHVDTWVSLLTHDHAFLVRVQEGA